jgi:hypothetical protein
LRPPRPDIAVPPLSAAAEWVGEAPPKIERLTAKGPVIVHFVDVGHLSSVRTLPYLAAWNERYGSLGLSVLGVNSPRFPFTGQRTKLEAALGRLDVPFPVASDPGYEIWRAYGCEGWPSTFLWAQGGVLGWFHFGEGEYAATEEEIRAMLPESAREAGLPDPGAALRPSDAPGAKVVPPTEETFPGGSPDKPWRAPPNAQPIELAYEGAGAAVTVDGRGELVVAIDDGPERAIKVDAPGVYELSEHPSHGAHELVLRPSIGLELYSFAFAPGVP